MEQNEVPNQLQFTAKDRAGTITHFTALQGTPLSATLSLVMSQCCRKIKDTVQKLASDHKDIHSSVSRVGKAIDRNFDSEICGVVSDAVWDSREKQQQVLQMAIVEHLYQQGMLSVAEELCQESTLNVDLDFKQPFLELNRILEALHEQDLGPALEWAVSHRQRLLELNSSLEFKLHRLHFIRLLAGGPEKQLEALSYARHFQPFARLHQREIQVMMGSLVYLRLGLEKSPYCHLLDNSHWAEICETFTRDACSLLGLSVESPLSVRYGAALWGQHKWEGLRGNNWWRPFHVPGVVLGSFRPKLALLVMLPGRNYLILRLEKLRLGRVVACRHCKVSGGVKVK
ncbi:E3 ubiquitin-protein transferase RMND5B-like [Leptonychotes weddellii]|uniref:E3 ubiquitin-protein transferase RMND5B-like n=1 Tax=Leptonychotes weddellii TaxID=9713 RepID=A0A7F8QXF4_LEPWE|nr:E3 ubiquitin-protein transferase RMND5B-like [Leptonychotes weddellii]